MANESNSTTNDTTTTLRQPKIVTSLQIKDACVKIGKDLSHGTLLDGPDGNSAPPDMKMTALLLVSLFTSELKANLGFGNPDPDAALYED